MTLVPIYVNDRAAEVASGTPAGEAVAALDDGWAEALSAGKAYLTDGRGIRLDPVTPLTAGAILRVVISSRASRESADADA
ncbi:MAG: hypothetical protein AB7R55_10155 [Gemmatimonadales bacterium]